MAKPAIDYPLEYLVGMVETYLKNNEMSKYNAPPKIQRVIVPLHQKFHHIITEIIPSTFKHSDNIAFLLATPEMHSNSLEYAFNVIMMISNLDGSIKDEGQQFYQE
jgi:hypothetical protein